MQEGWQEEVAYYPVVAKPVALLAGPSSFVPCTERLMPETIYSFLIEYIDVLLVIDDNTEQTFNVPALVIREEETTEAGTNSVDPYAYINLPNQETLIATQETGQWMVQSTVNTLLEAQRWAGNMRQRAIGQALMSLPPRIRQRPALYEWIPG